jgi:hypothetical protein
LIYEPIEGQSRLERQISLDDGHTDVSRLDAFEKAIGNSALQDRRYRMHSDLHALRLAAFEAGKAYYAASTQYFGAISRRSLDREIKQALDQCIITGEQYRTALKMYLDGLQNSVTHVEVEGAVEGAQKLLDLLGLELQKFFALR